MGTLDQNKGLLSGFMPRAIDGEIEPIRVQFLGELDGHPVPGVERAWRRTA